MPAPEPKNRPQLLTWLCTGSFVFGSLWIIMLLALILFDQAGNVSNRLFPGIAIEYLQAGYLFLLAEILLTAIGIFAVVLMWQMKKTGFYLYAVTKTIIYFLPVVAIGGHHLTFPALLLTSFLITAYGIMFIDESGNFRKFMLKK
jgi:hypothetical protein